MNPRLVAMDGPLQGEVLSCVADVISVGRHSANTIAVADPSVSRQHCLLRKREEHQYELVDRASRNGTFVNSLPVRERILEHGDDIRIGNCRFVYLVRQEDEEPTPSATLSQGDSLATRTIVQLPRRKALYLDPDRAASSSSIPLARLALNLKAMLKASTTVRATRGMDALAKDLMELILDAIPAAEAAILLFERGGEEPDWTFVWKRGGAKAEAIEAHRELVRRSFSEDVAILSNDLSSAGTPGSAVSLLVAPLAGAEKPLGVLYLVSRDPRVEFDEEHLQLLTAIASVSGLALENARYYEQLSAENRRLRQEIDLDHDMVGESAAMEEVYRFISKVAPTESTVLLYGESGTGKELVARAIHRNSDRSASAFVAINCAALPETLLESELFGHEKGSFTGALAMKRGKFEVADGGTIFLDEIGEVPSNLQVKLLRVIQEREFERVGGTRPVKVDVRVIAATNRDLRAAIKAGQFRDDLYYRLNVLALEMPPLRDRRADIPLLAAYFADKFARQAGRRNPGLSAEVRAILMNYDWPGNVRELENVVERAVVLGVGERIVVEDLPETLVESVPIQLGATSGFHQAIQQEKRRLIVQAIRDASGSHNEAAKALGIQPTYLSRLIRSLNLKDDIKRSVRA
ncbi:MAG: sigma 54-interacting transcriptional regulator [Bryobacteraceae bacterium]|nr:sigma 54-interacting transcriptional regulator [Bryobacteraceae bacterium]